DLRVLLERVVPALAPESGFLVAAEREARVIEVVGVDPHRPGLQRLRRSEGLLDVARPDRGGEAVDGAVADGDGFALVPEGQRGEDRSEDLLSGDRHLGRDRIEDRGLEEGALPLDGGAASAGDELRALRPPALDVSLDVLALRFRDERSEAGLRVQRIRRDELLRALDDLLHQLVVRGLLDEETGACRAELPLA